MLTLKETRTSEPFDSLAEAEDYLRENNWKPFHAGLWRNGQWPGASRDIRHPNQKKFVIIHSEYVSK